MKKIKKTLIISGIALFLIIGFLLILYFRTSQSILVIEKNNVPLPLANGTFNFAGTQGTYETLYLGCLTSGYYNINNNHDEEIALCNSIESDSKLTLYSSNKIIGSSNGGTNYIEAKITLPAGKVKADYSYQVTDYYGDSASVSFTLDDVVKTFKTPWFHTYERGGSVSGDGIYEFTLKKPKEVIFKIETTTDSKNEITKGTLNIEFTPNKFEPIKWYLYILLGLVVIFIITIILRRK